MMGEFNIGCRGCGRSFVVFEGVLSMFWTIGSDGMPDRCRVCGSRRIAICPPDGSVVALQEKVGFGQAYKVDRRKEF